MKLTDNIFAYHTFIYIRQKAKVNLELRVKEPAPPSPALSEFKKNILSHTVKAAAFGVHFLNPEFRTRAAFEICNSF